jgi:molecular chaperone DnaJ
MTRSKEDVFRIMNVDEHATVDDIKKQYRMLAMVHHPDRNGGSEERFKELQEAYETLTDPEKRRKLEKTRTAAPRASMDGLFQSMFAFHAKQERLTISINVNEIMYGCYRTLQVKKQRECVECGQTGVANHKKNVIQCRECYGKGTNQMFPEMKCFSCSGQGIFILNHAKCLVCEGKGTIQNTEEHVVYVPPGTRPSEVLHPSDELVVIVTHALDDDNVRFRDDDIELSVNVTPKELLLGFQKNVQLGHNTYRVRSSHCFNLDQTIRLPNKGIQDKGDLLVRFRLCGSSKEDQVFLRKLRNAIKKIGLLDQSFEEDTGEGETILLDVQEYQEQ